jgi:DNA (cytosine-5)-methyltransferase 1
MSRYGVPFVKGPQVELPPHPLACDLDDLATYVAAVKKPLAIDLFCGAGGLSYGLHLAGFEVILAAEIEREAAETHRAHFGGATICADLSQQTVLDDLCDRLAGIELDLVAGGPPCQPYSQAAFSKVRHLEAFHGRKADSRRDLWSSFVQVIERTRPKAVLVENVPDMAFGRDGVVLRQLVDDLERLGYEVYSRVLASDSFGVPQHRQRLFTVAFREPRAFAWPMHEDFVQRVLRDAIGDLPEVEAGDKQEVRPYTGKPTGLQHFFRQSVPEEEAHLVYDHYTRAVRPDDLEAFKLMTSKTRYSDLPEHLKRYRDDIFEDKYKRLDMDKLSRTITAHISQDGYWYIHPTQHRTLTIREAARIQTFPDNYRFCGYPRHAFKQIGEAVPPLLGKAVAASVLKALSAGVTAPTPATSDFSSAAKGWLFTQVPEEMIMPWLIHPSPWGVLLGHLLFDRTKKRAPDEYRETVARWPSPRSLLEDQGALDFASTRFKFELFESLHLLAQGLSEGRFLTAEFLEECRVPASLSLRMLASTGTGTRRPLNGGLERLVRRCTGTLSRPEDGRGNAEMLFGRMLGIDNDGTVFRAMNEIAARYCKPGTPACDGCPLKHLCAQRVDAPRQIVLDFAFVGEVTPSSRIEV